MRRLTVCPLIFFVALVSGCGSSGNKLSPEKREQAQKVLESGLAAWKSGETSKKWTDKSAAVQFHDFQWKEGFQLVEYRLDTIRATKQGEPEALVTLTLQKAKTKSFNHQALYTIYFTNQLIVTRDPLQ